MTFGSAVGSVRPSDRDGANAEVATPGEAEQKGRSRLMLERHDVPIGRLPPLGTGVARTSGASRRSQGSGSRSVIVRSLVSRSISAIVQPSSDNVPPVDVRCSTQPETRSLPQRRWLASRSIGRRAQRSAGPFPAAGCRGARDLPMEDAGGHHRASSVRVSASDDVPRMGPA